MYTYIYIYIYRSSEQFRFCVIGGHNLFGFDLVRFIRLIISAYGLILLHTNMKDDVGGCPKEREGGGSTSHVWILELNLNMFYIFQLTGQTDL